ncbi:signal peptidase I [Bacillus horti]|uniref:signal peptidase I n=1 Tax=Caldalkalibacillus horti TaxID=77523 RepID=UPI003522810D
MSSEQETSDGEESREDEWPEETEGNTATKKEKNETWEWVKALGIAIIIAVVIRMFLFAPIVVDGTSMVPTLQHNERLIVNKAIYYLQEPKRGDILVFHAELNKDWIKRVIGEPGDIVEVRNDELYINGERMNEPYLDESKALASGALTNDFYEEVPEGHIFVMGDNRQNSRDSRSIGSISIDTVVGRADIVFWPFSDFQFVKRAYWDDSADVQ